MKNPPICNINSPIFPEENLPQGTCKWLRDGSGTGKMTVRVHPATDKASLSAQMKGAVHRSVSGIEFPVPVPDST